MKRILVTGGAGFIGTHLVNKLKDYHKIFVLDNLSNKRSEETVKFLIKNDISFFKEDIRDKDKLINLIKECKPDSCIHLAAKISVSESMIDPYTTMDINVTGTLNVLEGCVQNSVKKFVFASSAAVYGHVTELPIREDIKLKPISPYGASKVAAEEIIDGYASLNLIDSIITLRMFNIYGKGQSNEYAGVISSFRDRIAKSLPPIIFGDGYQQRDFISIDDVVQSFVLALNMSTVSKMRTFNVGTGVPTSINDLSNLMTELMGKPDLNALHKNAIEGDIRLSCADTSNSFKFLKFSHSINLATGIKQFIQD